MNSLPVRILAAVLTFTLGVGLTNLWLTTPGINPIVCPFPVGTRPAQLEMVFQKSRHPTIDRPVHNTDEDVQREKNQKCISR